MISVRRWPPVLMFHAVDEIAGGGGPVGLCIPPDRFRAQMLHLKRRGMRGVSMRELLQLRDTPEGECLVGLTFDDGYQDFLRAAVPILEEVGFTATVFVVGGLIGKINDWDEGPARKLLDAAELAEVARRGFEVGAHSMSHPRLDRLDPEALRQEVDAGEVLGRLIGRPVEGFCYPYGEFNRGVVQAVRAAGYSYACAYRSASRHGPYDIPRIYIGPVDNGRRLGLKLRFYRYYAKAARLLH